MKTRLSFSVTEIMRRLVLLVLAAAAVPAVHGQQQEFSGAEMGYDYPRTLSSLVVSPSPEATAMYRYQDCPVSYATGAAEISVPLLECRSGDLGIALSLSYHTGGIKVSDEAGSIALGWTLGGLGRVSRQVCVLPDEDRPFDIKGSTTASLKNQLLYNTDANYDRYSYDFPGYSGVFFITEDSLVHMSNNGVKIERMCSSKNKFATDSFAIVTPEGIRYTFGQREICKREHWVANGTGSYTDISYEVPVVWNLTTIQSLLTSEKITVTYTTDNYERHDDPPVTLKYGRRWSYDSTQDCYMTSVSTYSDGVTRYFGRATPEVIKGSSFIIYCSGGSGRIGGMILRKPDRTEVRKVEFSFDNISSKKRQLKSVKITSGGKTVDRRTFTYHEGSGSGCDFFGYANGSTDYLKSVLDLSTLKLNSARRHNADLVKSWSLKSMTDVTGAVTEFTYISKHWTPPAGSQNNRLTSVYNGIAVSKIETRDPLTGRSRTRTFSYSEPVMSVPLQYLTINDFISLSGSKTYFWKFMGSDAYSIYTLTAELTSSCRRPGFAAENMVIYFNKVTETVTGTDIDHAVRTDYEFDNSRCIHILGTPSMQKAPAAALYSSTEPIQTSMFSMILGENIPYSAIGHVPQYGIPQIGIADFDGFEKVFSTKYMTSGFTERIDPSPLLVRKISYEYRNGSYKPAETVENYYSSGRHATLHNGRYVQGNVYKSSVGNEYSNALDKSGAIDVCNVYTQSDFMRLDSTATTRHYPDGNSRRIITRHSYGSLLDGSGRSVTCDTLALNAMSPSPHSTLSRFGNEYFLTDNVRAEDVATSFYRSAAQKGFRRLPVFQKWKSAVGTTVDSIEIRQEYAAFGGVSPLRSRTSLLRGGQTAAVQTIKTYDAEANITSMTETDGTSRRYTWYPKHRLLASASVGPAYANMTTYYTWEPLVGCTSIATPSGRGRIFSYSGGRLASERNTAGDTVATYSYSLYADTGANITEASVRNDKGAATTRVWYDGFGLPVQSVAAGAGANSSQDVCSFTEYDGLDRPVRQWQPLPVSGTDSIYTDTDLRSFASSVYGADSRPFTQTCYLASAGEKVSAVYLAGDALADHPAQTSYLCNNTTDPELTVKHYTFFNHPLGEGIHYIGLYSKGTLDAVKSVDPDGHTIITFTNWRGFKILERRKLSATDFLDIYYINNVWGEPLLVLQPAASNKSMSDGSMIPLAYDKTLSDNTFIYRYDRCGRLISKKIPGCEPVSYRYDPYGRLAFMQDGNMRDAGRAMFTLYDEFSRVAVTGMCDDDAMAGSVTIPSMTVQIDNSLTFPGICNTGYLAPSPELFQNAELLTAAYYDSYDFLGLDAFSALPQENTSSYASAKGLATGTLTAVLGSNSSTAPIAAVTYYDNEERPVKTLSTTSVSQYETDGYIMQTMTYTLDSQISKSIESLRLTGRSPLILNTTYTYDHIGRHTGTKTGLSMSQSMFQTTLSKYYNSLGQLKKQSVGAFSTTYTYNIAGSLKTYKNSFQNTELKYWDGDTPCYSGKISCIADQKHHLSRSFTYDGAGRLVSAVSRTGTTASDPITHTYAYDRNSNLVSVGRMGLTAAGSAYSLVDDLTMVYNGNRLIKVSDSAPEILYEKSFDFHDGADLTTEYAYDSNGNMVCDENRGIREISYNPLNLPRLISYKNDMTEEFIYDASGRRLSSMLNRSAVSTASLDRTDDAEPVAMTDAAVSGQTDIREYAGCFEFIQPRSQLRVHTPYGYYDFKGTFHLYLRDWQGNIEYIVSSNDLKPYKSERHNVYYPYGLPMAESQGDNPYRFGGKDFDVRNGVNIYDFGARTYAPDIARFMQPDPQAGDYHWLSPYAYCAGDPINFVDPDGCSTWVTLEPDGRYKVIGGDLNDNDLNIYVGTMQEDGTFIKESSIGMTPVITSFYDSDKGEWAKDSYIDTSDMSGMEFIDNMTGYNVPGLIDYMLNARNGKKYDFKVTNGTASIINGIDIYRGMPMGKTEKGMTIYTSARDIGNIVAGYVAKANGLSWPIIRLGFDAYQSYKDKRITFEGLSSQAAQYYGYKKAKAELSWKRREFNFYKSILFL